MNKEDIRPIPKYIANRIKKLAKDYPCNTKFVSYITKQKKELVKVTVAVKNKKGNVYMKQVAIHGIDSKECLTKDMEYYTIAGYVVGWHSEGLTKYFNYYEDGKWYYAEDKHFNPYAICINLDYVLKQKEFKYCAIDIVNTVSPIKYLRLYRKYPEMEYLAKARFPEYVVTSKVILNKLSKEKKFRAWLLSRRDEIGLYGTYITAITYAYKHNIELSDANNYIKLIQSVKDYKSIKQVFNGNYIKLADYLDKQQQSLSIFNDYLYACQELELDLTLDKNLFPHDLMHWHDVRIDELHTLQAQRDEEKRKELAEKFNRVAIKYMSLQKENNKGEYLCLIAKTPDDLITEGQVLDHCVGRMNYDQKFIKEESLIFFIRNKQDSNTPFVTLEYSPTKHKVLQCYGEHDSRPSNEVLHYVNNIWLPYANKQLKQLCA